MEEVNARSLGEMRQALARTCEPLAIKLAPPVETHLTEAEVWHLAKPKIAWHAVSVTTGYGREERSALVPVLDTERVTLEVDASVDLPETVTGLITSARDGAGEYVDLRLAERGWTTATYTVELLD